MKQHKSTCPECGYHYVHHKGRKIRERITSKDSKGKKTIKHQAQYTEPGYYCPRCHKNL